jgi:hypothetical protein
LLPKIEEWLNETMSDSTGYSPVEIMYNEPRPDLFRRFLKKEADEKPPPESLKDKVLKAYLKMKMKAERRNRKHRTGKTVWEPQVGDLVLAKCQPTSNAAISVTSEFVRPYDGPWKISRRIPPSTFELTTLEGAIRGVFNKQALKPYLRDD